MRPWKRPWPALLAGLLLGLGGCVDDGEVPARAVHAPAGARPEPALVPTSGAAAQEAGEARSRAEAAMRDGRLYAPAGGNEVEHYLALRRLAPADAGASTALAELAPYLLIAAEQALAEPELEEARRLLGLMAAGNPEAPALPRLWEHLERMEAMAAPEAEAARTDAVVEAVVAGSAEVSEPGQERDADPPPQLRASAAFQDAAGPEAGAGTPALPPVPEPVSVTRACPPAPASSGRRRAAPPGGAAAQASRALSAAARQRRESQRSARM